MKNRVNQINVIPHKYGDVSKSNANTSYSSPTQDQNFIVPKCQDLVENFTKALDPSVIYNHKNFFNCAQYKPNFFYKRKPCMSKTNISKSNTKSQKRNITINRGVLINAPAPKSEAKAKRGTSTRNFRHTKR